MKYLIVLVACAALVAVEAQLSEEQRARAKALAATCIEQEGVTKEQAQTLRQGKFEGVDQKLKCFANCLLEKGDLVANGQIKPDVVLKKLGPIFGEEKVKAAQAKCDSLKGVDNCDTSFQLYQCYFKNNAQF